MRAWINVPVLGRHDVGVAVVAGDKLRDRGSDVVATRGGEAAAGAKIVLNIDDEQCCFHNATIHRVRKTPARISSRRG